MPSSRAARGEKGFETALQSAMRLLARRSYTQAELRSQLESRWDPSAVAAALARLIELRLIDDAALAERLASDRFERGGRGRHRILSELVARGVDADLASDVVGRVIAPERERELAQRLVTGLLSGRSEVDRPAGERQLGRAFRRLVARGFPAALVRDLLAGS